MSEFPLCRPDSMTRVNLFGRIGTGPGTALWQKGAQPALDRALLKARRTDYGREVEESGIIWTYSCRQISGSSSHSEHSHPRAFDVNPPTNGMNDAGILRCDFGKFRWEDGADFVNAFVSEGFAWGGDGWTGRPITAEWLRRSVGTKIRDGRVDAMHFEYDGPDEPPPRRKVSWVLRFKWDEDSPTTHRRVFLRFKRLRHFIRRRNRINDEFHKVDFEKHVEQVSGR